MKTVTYVFDNMPDARACADRCDGVSETAVIVTHGDKFVVIVRFWGVE